MKQGSSILKCSWRKTEQRPQVICTDNFVKLGRAAFEMCRQTDKHARRNTLHPSRGRSDKSASSSHVITDYKTDDFVIYRPLKKFTVQNQIFALNI